MFTRIMRMVVPESNLAESKCCCGPRMPIYIDYTYYYPIYSSLWYNFNILLHFNMPQIPLLIYGYRSPNPLKKELLDVQNPVFYLKKKTTWKYIFVNALDGSEMPRNGGIRV